MQKKFEINRKKIKGTCKSGRKVVTHDSKSDLPLVQSELDFISFSHFFKGDPDMLEEISVMEDDKILFLAADKNGDKKLTQEEFLTFTHPNVGMIYPILSAVLRAKDQDKDGRISVQESISSCESAKFNDWVGFEKKRFNEELEVHKDGFLYPWEILAWLMPENTQ